MTLEDKCRKLREWAKSEQDVWRTRKQFAIDNEDDDGVAECHTRICAIANVLRRMDQLGIAADE